jgi:hypothetical protein
MLERTMLHVAAGRLHRHAATSSIDTTATIASTAKLPSHNMDIMTLCTRPGPPLRPCHFRNVCIKVRTIATGMRRAENHEPDLTPQPSQPELER